RVHRSCRSQPGPNAAGLQDSPPVTGGTGQSCARSYGERFRWSLPSSWVEEGLLDRYVVERARSGDLDAFADLVHQISDSLLGVARRILRDPGLAEDVLQNALLT